MSRAEQLLAWATQAGGDGLLVAGLSDRAPVVELERRGAVRVARERDDESGFHARVYANERTGR